MVPNQYPTPLSELTFLRARVAQLEEEIARRRRDAEAMAEAARLAGGGLDLGDLADRIVGSIVTLFGAAAATIRRLDPDGSLVDLAWTGSPGSAGFERGRVLPPGVGTAARAIALGRAVWTPDVLAEPDVVLSPDLRRAAEVSGNRAVLSVPLTGRDRVLGAVTVVYPLGHVFQEDEVRLAAAFADQVAIALEKRAPVRG